MIKVLLVFTGGGLGSLLRYGISVGVKKWSSLGFFPWATLIANLMACAILALVMVILRSKMSENHILLWATGFCGGLSTFSTFSYENIELINRQLYGYAALNIGLSLILCLGCILLISKAMPSV